MEIWLSSAAPNLGRDVHAGREAQYVFEVRLAGASDLLGLDQRH